MKKLSKTFLSIFMCAILSVCIIPSAFAELGATNKAALRELHAQYNQIMTHNKLVAHAELYKWRQRVWNQIEAAGNSNPNDSAIPGEAFAYLASKVTGNRFLKHIKVWGYTIKRYSDNPEYIKALKCYITTTYSKEVCIEL